MIGVLTKVRMVHPDLPAQPIWVAESAVPVHMASGWQQQDEPPKSPKPPKPAPEAAPSAAPVDDKPAARRRTPEPAPSTSEE